MAKASPMARQDLLTSDHLGLWPPTHVLLATGWLVLLVLPWLLGAVKPMEGGVVQHQVVNVRLSPNS